MRLMPRSPPPRQPKKLPKRHGGGNVACLLGEPVGTPLLLDEMFSGSIAGQLRAKGHDVLAVVADSALLGLADEQILAHATAAGRALVTLNIKDFMPLDARCRAANQTHAGLILVSAKTFPQDSAFTAAIISALSTLLGQPGQIQPGQVRFLPRR
jgi:hypothetical protein